MKSGGHVIRQSFPIYQSAIPKLGLLDSAEIDAIIHAYSYVYGFPEQLSIIGEVKSIDGFSARIIVSDKFASVITAWDKQLIFEINKAISAISR